jgi:exodeoxyribonuclease VII large subunit
MNDIFTKKDPLTVTQISQSVKMSLEDIFPYVLVKGEISGVKTPASGHMYFDLKDENSVLHAICWRGAVSKLSIKPEEGMEVICQGKITSYPQRSNYQMIISTMELAGQGALIKLLEERKKKLAAEGLFDQSRKKKLPYLPKTIGVVTSSTGAVIRDIMHRIEDRFPTRVLLIPSLVQGTGAENTIAKAIDDFNLIKGEDRPDVLIVARGGGSFEDLMPFNEEVVVRAVANSEIPVISAVGHETDTTLIDHVSDMRAPTPTAAAEIAVPVRSDIMNFLLKSRETMYSSVNMQIDKRGNYLEAMKRGLIHPNSLIENYMQRLDAATDRLTVVMKNELSKKEEVISSYKRLLESYSYKNVLQRGYAMISSGEKVVTSVKDLSAGQEISIHLQDGDAKAEVS